MEDRPKTSFALSSTKLELLASRLAEEGIGEDTSQSIPRRKNSEEFPISSGQQRLWFLDRLEMGIHYNDHFNLQLTGALNVTALERAIGEILRRHEAMRSVFTELDGVACQSIASAYPLALPRIDLTNLPESDRMTEAVRLAVEEARAPFNLSQGPIWRFALISLSGNEHLLLITAHHIAIDGWSRGVFLRELSVLYPAFTAGGSSPLKDLPIQYADYAAWQAEWLRSETVAKQLDYWKRRLAGAPSFLALPSDRPRPAIQSFRGARHSLTVSRETTAALKDLCQREHATLFMALLVVLQILLNRYTGHDDILLGTPVANRMRKELEELIGYFLNTLVLRATVSGDPTFRELLLLSRETTLEALAHQDLPLERLIDALQPERNQSYAPLFQVLLVLQNTPMPNLQMAGLSVRESEIDNGTAKFDLTISLAETPEGLAGWIEYVTDLFDADRIERFAGHFQGLIQQVIENPNARLSEISVLTAGERMEMARRNQTRADYPCNRCIHELFEEQARRTPDRTAIELEGERWTYDQLNRAADQIAVCLRSLGLRPDTLVGVCMERSPQMVAAVLGILKAGAAYLPLDPACPTERLAFVLQDAQARAVVTERPLMETVRELAAGIETGSRPRVVCVDEILAAHTEGQDPTASGAGPGNLAYVIFTSGSTGKPKGVQIEHRSVVNFLESMRRAPGLSAEDILVAVTTLSFDIAGLEMFLPLTTGGRVVLASRETASDGHRLARLLERSRATVMQATPATWRLLLAADWKGRAGFKILCGGEAWNQELAEQLLSRCASLWNMYGPTETTIWSAASRVTSGRPVLIDRPIANTQFYIVDRFFQLAPVGVPGELCIGGHGVARGYWNRQQMTSENFLPDPFSEEPGARLYRTGDLARYRSDGAIEFLGRMDHQVKLRGFRVELGEIDSVLSDHARVRQAVVTVREDLPGDPRLVAYLVASPEDVPSHAELRDWVRSKLPEYMVPAEFVTIEALPLTPNGKVDRRALPAPSRIRIDIAPGASPPRDALEQQLVRIWENILCVHPVSLTDNFFDLGGHSLTAVRLFSEIRKQTGRNLPLATLFQAPTVEQLAGILRKDGWSPRWSSLVPIQPGGSKPPFFCVHGAAGNVLLFRDLARRLGVDYPFYGLQSKGLDGKGNYLTTINEMASLYLKEVRELQPEGPYYLGGFCMGGTVAYEMAQQLHKKGQQVRLLALLETYNHNGVAPQVSFQRTARNLKQKIYFHWANVTRLPLRERIAYLGEKLRGARVREASRLSAKLAGLSKLLGVDNKSDTFLESVNEEAGYAYRPQEYPGDATLFLPQRNYDFLSKPYMGWKEFVAGLEVIELPVYPGGIFLEPYVRVLSDKLRARIDAVEKPEEVALNV